MKFASALLILTFSMWAFGQQKELPFEEEVMAVVEGEPLQHENLDSDPIEIQIDIPPEDVEEAVNPKGLAKLATKLSNSVPAKLDRLFTKLKIPNEVKDPIVEDMSRTLWNARVATLEANAGGIQARGLIGFNLGINQDGVELLKDKRGIKHIIRINNAIAKAFYNNKLGFLVPKGSRVGFVLNGGVGIIRTEGKTIIRLMIETENPVRAITFMAIGNAGGNISKLSEVVDEKIKTFERKILERIQMGPIGTLTVGENYTEYAVGAAASTSPVVSSSFFYFNKVRQYRINLVLNHTWIKKISKSALNSCSKFFWNRRVINPPF